MGILSYTTSVSIDGYIADANGDFQWGAPDEAVFALHLARMAEVSTEVMGRKTYELMRYWETYPDGEEAVPGELEFAHRWKDIDKVVVSSTLTPAELGPEPVRLVPELSLGELQQIVDSVPDHVEIFGPTTAAPAIRAGMVRDFRFFVVPKMIGGGLRALPDGVHLDLRPAEHRTFDDGTAYLRYLPR